MLRRSSLALFAAFLLLLGSASSSFAQISSYDWQQMINLLQTISTDLNDQRANVNQLMNSVGTYHNYDPTLIELVNAIYQNGGATAVTNFLGFSEFGDRPDFQGKLGEALYWYIVYQFYNHASQELPTIFEDLASYSSSWMVYPGLNDPYIAVGSFPMAHDGQPIFDSSFAQDLGSVWYGDLLPSIASLLSSNQVTLSASAVASISNAVSSGMSVPDSDVEEPPDVEDQLNQYQLENTETDPVTNITSNLPLWSYSATPTLEMSPLEQATLADGATGFSPADSGIPILSGAISSPWIDLPSWTVEPSETQPWRTYVVGWKRRIGSITSAFWSVIAFFAVAFVVRREWNYYASLGRSQSDEISEHEHEMDIF